MLQAKEVNQINIKVDNLGKKFGREWIFRNLSLSILPQEKIVLLGGNGSGKSTLLQVLANYQMSNEGTIQYHVNRAEVGTEEVYKYLSIATPYLELIEEFTLLEMIEHHQHFKPFQSNLSTKQVVAICELESARNKFIRNFSSGMKQRVRLALSILSDCPLLLLDEPISNLDAKAIDWYKSMIQTYAMHKTILVCSNKIKDEYEFCSKEINVEDYKIQVKTNT